MKSKRQLIEIDYNSIKDRLKGYDTFETKYAAYLAFIAPADYNSEAKKQYHNELLNERQTEKEVQ